MKRSAVALRQSIAGRVAQLVQQRNALNRWRQLVRTAYAERQEQGRALDAWLKRQQVHVVEAWKRRQKGAEESDTPPAEGWTWGGGRISTGSGNETLFFTWLPPELSENQRPHSGLLLPLSSDRPLSLAGSCAVLAAIHDATLSGVEPINPWTRTQEMRPRIFYECLLRKVNDLQKADFVSLKALLGKVEADPSAGPKPGQKQAADRAVSQKTGKAKGKRIDERMAKKLLENPNSVHWTAEYWSEQLKCSKSTVHDTLAWEKIMTMRKERDVERTTTHQNKRSDRRRLGGQRRSETE